MSFEYSYSLDPNKKPIYFAELNEPIKIYTENAFGGDIENEKRFAELTRTNKHHPLTGPIYINGVKAGMYIEIEVLDIYPNETGYQCCSKSSGMIDIEPFCRNIKEIHYFNGLIKYDDLLLKAYPSVGVIGTAVASKTRSGRLSQTGGNIDIKEIRKGAKVILPCHYDGALLYVGDMHLLQGNGEISGIAAEVSGSIYISVNVSEYKYDFPIICSENGITIVGYGESINESILNSVENAITFLCKEGEMKEVDAYMILSLIGNIQLGHSTGKVVSSGVFIANEQFPI